jgi:VIT1/CCC1 family predicted Fe2+/Mn2+ transporter
MVALEFGVIEKERRQPYLAGLTSGLLFFVGSLPSILPFMIIPGQTNPMYGLYLAIGSTFVTLFIVGIVKSFATRMHWFYSSLENFAIVGFGGVFAYWIGSWLQ